jgi:hypothetical protein
MQRRLALLTLPLLGAPGAAQAGSGPWVVGPGETSVYLGVDAQRLTKLHVVDAEGGEDVLDVGEGLSTFGMVGIFTYGLLDRVEIEGTLPWYRVTANRPDADLCDLLGLRACAPTQTVGLLKARAKVLLLDEVFQAPLSLAVGAEVRNGTFTARTRERITNVGEGTLDLGGFLAAGRSGRLGQQGGFWTASGEATVRHRFPNTDAYPAPKGTTAAPNAELDWSLSALLAPQRPFGFGPTAFGLWRPGGLDFGELDLSDPDRWAALRITNVRLGGELLVRSEQGAVFSLKAAGTVHAVNNPTDVFLLSAGLKLSPTAPREARDPS